ncbi:MAG TPA: glycosyltransferase family 9 protein [Saprospiraceae bacterium]|nr:glycosyltransferase family 9 protein [Saprospiraceae bacterium]HNK08698.1 glycosyltransferase family 9 protein [Saprospiraceae bacterium]HNP09715.1 glycosyltransferase family 9 protein [Saprospiraceae bacterium]
MNPAIKVLIVRFSSIGDIVLTTPVIRCIKQQLGAEVHFLTKPGFAGLLTDNPYIDQLWTLEEDYIGLIRKIKEERFDYLIDLHKNLRTWWLAFQLGVKRLTYHKATIEKLLMVKFKINVLPKSHVSERYLDAVKSLGIKYDGQGLDYFISEDTVNKLDGVDSLYIAAVIGATHFTKRLPEENWITFINSTDRLIVLIGGKAEAEAAEHIVARSGSNVINMVGKTNLQESALIIQNAERVITNDTGMMHIAAALGKPIVSIWGGTLWEYGFWPFYSDGKNLNKSLEVKGLSCRPCSKFGRNDCPRKHFKCMKDLKIEL